MRSHAAPAPALLARLSEAGTDLLASLVETSSDFIAVARPDESVIYVNEAGRDLVGLQPAEAAAGKTIGDFMAERPDGAPPADFLRGFRGETALRHFVTGEAIDVELVATLVIDPEGRPEAIATLARDIRERKRAEAEIARLASERLQLALLAMRETELQRRRLSEALHDDVIQSLLVARQDVQEVLEGDVSAAAHAMEALGQAISALRGQVSRMHPVALAHGDLATAIGELGGPVTEAGIQFESDVERGLPREHNTLIYEIVRELVRNAMAHAAPSRIAVAVERRAGDVVASVRDDGAGIPPGRLASALAQGHIGLAAARERARGAGGRLEIGTADGGGTIVRLVLRCPRAAVPAQDAGP
jgi:PAS domain S-box-containing protein